MDFQPKSQDDMQRAMQFLLDQQAQFAADLAKLAEARAADDVRWNERFQQPSGKTDQIAVGLIGLTGIVGQLAAAQQRTDKRMDDVGEYIKTVESHLNEVIEMFERHLREDHGRPPS